MRIDQRVKKCIAFVGHKGANDSFAVEGTAFFAMTYEGGLGFQQLITARHVIEDGFAGKEWVYLRVNSVEGTPRVLRTLKSEWLFHPNRNVDIAFLPMEISQERCDILHVDMEDYVLTEQSIKDNDIGEGDDVFVVGAYVSRVGELKNLPIVRVGNIASMAVEPVWPASISRPAYLIEVRSLGGLSGSPVFVHVPLIAVKDGQTKFHNGRYEYMLGMVLGHHANRHDVDVLPGQEDVMEDSEKADFSTGIAVVVPVEQINEALQQPLVVDMRKRAVEEMKKKSGYVADSAGRRSKGEPKSTTHREDFNSLLDAAVRAKP